MFKISYLKSQTRFNINANIQNKKNKSAKKRRMFQNNLILTH